VTKKPPLIAKEEAFAVLQKAADYDVGMKRITLGKPEFDEHSTQFIHTIGDVFRSAASFHRVNRGC
jgi:hypothetical protein